MRAFRWEGRPATIVFLFSFLLGLSSRAENGLFFLPPKDCLPMDGGGSVPLYVYCSECNTASVNPDFSTTIGTLGKPVNLGNGIYSVDFHPSVAQTPSRAAITASLNSSAKETHVEKIELLTCPYPAGKLSASALPKQLLAEENRQATIFIQVTNADGNPAQSQIIEATSNIGALGPITEIGKGEYRTTFYAPEDPYPQVAILAVANPSAARMDRIAAARIVIPIAAQVSVPGKTKPKTRMEIQVAGKTFGPVIADATGDFKVPILVPPGYGKAQATSVDAVGNKKSQPINLYLPETNQLGIWSYPKTLTADGKSRSRLLVTTIDPFGLPSNVGKVIIKARLGKVSDLKPLSVGLFESIYIAPVQAGTDLIEVTFPQGGKKSIAKVEIVLLPGPAEKMRLSLPELLPADGATPASVSVEAKDGRDNLVKNASVTLTASIGKLSLVSQNSAGVFETTLLVDPNPIRWGTTVRAEVRPLPGDTPARIVVPKNAIRIRPSGFFGLHVLLVDNNSNPVAEGIVEQDDGFSKQVHKTDSFGWAEFEISCRTEKKPCPCVLRAEKGVEKQIFILQENQKPVLLPIGLDDSIWMENALVESQDIRLHPATKINIKMEAVVPQKPDVPWIVRVKIEGNALRPIKDIQLGISVSSGTVGPLMYKKDNVFEAELRPPEIPWDSIAVSVIEPMDHVGAVLTIGSKRTQP
jgi:hypothetical protein